MNTTDDSAFHVLLVWLCPLEDARSPVKPLYGIQNMRVRPLPRAKHPTFCLENPGSTTYTMPSMVSDVSATLVDTTTFLPTGPPGNLGPGASLNIFCWAAGGNDEYSGYTASSPSYHGPGEIRPVVDVEQGENGGGQ